MITHSPLRKPAILVGLLFGLTLACGKASPPPPATNPERSGGKVGSAAGGAGGTSTKPPETSSGGTSGAAGAGGVTASGGAPGAGGSDNAGGAAGAGGASTDTGPEPTDTATPEDVKVDAPPTCTNPCVLGRKRCGGQTIEECQMEGQCPVWKMATSCQAPLVCTAANNSASCACPKICGIGDKRCAAGKVEECAQVNGCPNWSNPTACQSPMECVQNGNMASCSCKGTCAPGGKRCMGQALQECKAGAAGTCPAWQDLKTCGGNTQCTDPQGSQPADCRCKMVCTLGQKMCVGDNMQECATVDGCPAWKNITCPGGQTCTQSGNSAQCGCPATACKIGEKQCKPGAPGVLQECRATGPGGCGQFVDAQTCDGGRGCVQGAPVQGKKMASCECPTGSCSAGEVRCDTTGVHQKCDATAGRCGTWVNDPCPAPRVCARNTQGAAAACNCPAGSCTIGAKKCSDDKKAIETCNDQGAQCGKFAPMATCQADQACTPEGTGFTCKTLVCNDPNKCDMEGAKRCGPGNSVQTCQRQNDPICPLVFKSQACTADQSCQTPKQVPVCCPKTCAATDCGPSNTTILRCRMDPQTGCMVPLPVACPDNGTCSKQGGAPAKCSTRDPAP